MLTPLPVEVALVVDDEVDDEADVVDEEAVVVGGIPQFSSMQYESPTTMGQPEAARDGFWRQGQRRDWSGRGRVGCGNHRPT